MNCDRCGSQGKMKQITSKKDGKKYDLYECTGSCMNGQYKYSWFPPKEKKTPEPNIEQQTQTDVMVRILAQLERIANALEVKSEERPF